MNAISPKASPGIAETLIAKGGLSRLTPEERGAYYMEVCRSVGLNPLTRPFEYLVLDGQMVLYARRDCADQLRKKNGISIEILNRSISNGLLTIHVRARDASGRTDEDLGVVNMALLKGEAAANAALKAVTKAKRRVTLSISGLGFLDETEVEDIRSPDGRDTHKTGNADAPIIPAPCKIVPQRVAMSLNSASTNIGSCSIPILQKDGKNDDLRWAQALLTAIEATKSTAKVNAWQEANWDTLMAMKATAPKLHRRTCARIAELRRALAQREKELAENLIQSMPHGPSVQKRKGNRKAQEIPQNAEVRQV